MRRLMEITKALSDENRVRALVALRQQELCVCQIIELLKLAPSTVSKHMSILRQARLVESRKAGRWIYYRLAEAVGPAESVAAVDWICSELAQDPRIQADGERLKAILKTDREDLCRVRKKN
jgi:DNA-binding transcriptional ArsR family regulator